LFPAKMFRFSFLGHRSRTFGSDLTKLRDSIFMWAEIPSRDNAIKI
jgi:hypothetical protein